jgi:hypothetical protein
LLSAISVLLVSGSYIFCCMFEFRSVVLYVTKKLLITYN